LKASAGAVGAEVIPPELLKKFLVAVDDPVAAAHLRLGRVSPSSAYWRFRKDGRLSTSSSCRMTHLLLMGAGPMLTPPGGKSVPDLGRRVDSGVWGPSTEAMHQTGR
jgi:hypothetical protein